jgi:hypothetical protein
MADYRTAALNLFAGKPAKVALAFTDGRVYWVPDESQSNL